MLSERRHFRDTLVEIDNPITDGSLVTGSTVRIENLSSAVLITNVQFQELLHQLTSTE